MTVRIGVERPDHPEVVALIRALDAYQQALYPPESNHLLDLASLVRPEVIFCVARIDGAAVGCGAALLACDTAGQPYGEIKRMYVDPGRRGNGLGRAILGFLEEELMQRNVTLARLETGIYQPEAIGLYERMGYRPIGPFGDYGEDPLSLFYEKVLAVQEEFVPS